MTLERIRELNEEDYYNRLREQYEQEEKEEEEEEEGKTYFIIKDGKLIRI